MNGPLGLSGAAQFYSHPNIEQPILSCNGYQTGYYSAYTRPIPSEGLSIRLYEFSGTAGATTFADSDTRATTKTGVATPFGDDTAVVSSSLDAVGNYNGVDIGRVGRVAIIVREFRGTRR